MRTAVLLVALLAVTTAACVPTDNEQAPETSDVDCLNVPPHKVDEIEAGVVAGRVLF